jgi:hypothetical protein
MHSHKEIHKSFPKQAHPSPAHMGSKNSDPHLAGGDAGWAMAAGGMPGSSTGSMPESAGPGGMGM